MSIEADTQIMPDVLAESIVDAAQAVTGMNIHNHRAAEKYLADHAEQIYARNAAFAKKVRSEANYGNAGRDYLAAFMQHWLASWLKKHDRRVYAQLPHGWAVSR